MMNSKNVFFFYINNNLRTEGESLAKEWGASVLFFETSAKADIAVSEVIMI